MSGAMRSMARCVLETQYQQRWLHCAHSVRVVYIDWPYIYFAFITGFSESLVLDFTIDPSPDSCQFAGRPAMPLNLSTTNRNPS